MRNVETEGFVLILLDELQGIPVDQMRRIALFHRFLSSMPPIVLHVITPVIDVIDIPAVIAFEIVKPVVLRVVVRVLFRVTEMPLAHDTRGVTSMLEQLRKGHLGFLQALPVLRMLSRGMNDGFDASALLVATGQEPGPCRRANRPAGMKIGEQHSLCSKPVHARGLVVRVAIGSNRWAGKTHIIDHHHDDVGASILGKGEHLETRE